MYAGVSMASVLSEPNGGDLGEVFPMCAILSARKNRLFVFGTLAGFPTIQLLGVNLSFSSVPREGGGETEQGGWTCSATAFRDGGCPPLEALFRLPGFVFDTMPGSNVLRNSAANRFCFVFLKAVPSSDLEFEIVCLGLQ